MFPQNDRLNNQWRENEISNSSQNELDDRKSHFLIQQGELKRWTVNTWTMKMTNRKTVEGDEQNWKQVTEDTFAP